MLWEKSEPPKKDCYKAIWFWWPNQDEQPRREDLETKEEPNQAHWLQCQPPERSPLGFEKSFHSRGNSSSKSPSYCLPAGPCHQWKLRSPKQSAIGLSFSMIPTSRGRNLFNHHCKIVTEQSSKKQLKSQIIFGKNYLALDCLGLKFSNIATHWPKYDSF